MADGKEIQLGLEYLLRRIEEERRASSLFPILPLSSTARNGPSASETHHSYGSNTSAGFIHSRSGALSSPCDYATPSMYDIATWSRGSRL